MDDNDQVQLEKLEKLQLLRDYYHGQLPSIEDKALRDGMRKCLNEWDKLGELLLQFYTPDHTP